MLRAYRVDSHVHTCLSPCGELEMTPRAIVRACRKKEIDVVAVCDHNSAENVPAVPEAAEGTGLVVFGGMEVTTAEEVHVLAIFDDDEGLLDLQREVYDHLIPGENDEDLFGIQVVANAKDEVESIVERLLMGGTTISLSQLVTRVHELGGVAVASHVDRESFSLLGQLGFVPDDLAVDALEVSSRGRVEDIRSRVPGVKRFPLVTSSDAHRLDEVGRGTTTFLLAEATLDEIRKGLRGVDGRGITEGGVSVC